MTDREHMPMRYMPMGDIFKDIDLDGVDVQETEESLQIAIHLNVSIEKLKFGFVVVFILTLAFSFFLPTIIALPLLVAEIAAFLVWHYGNFDNRELPFLDETVDSMVVFNRDGTYSVDRPARPRHDGRIEDIQGVERGEHSSILLQAWGGPIEVARSLKESHQNTVMYVLENVLEEFKKTEDDDLVW